MSVKLTEQADFKTEVNQASQSCLRTKAACMPNFFTLYK